MSWTRRGFLLAAACAVGPGAPRAGTLVWRGAAMGGEAEIRLTGPRDAAEAALAEVEAEIRRLERAFSLHHPDSALARLNATGALDAPPLALVDAIDAADRWRRLSDGAFDARVQPLWRALAEGRDGAAARAALARPWADDVSAAPSRLRLSPGVALTLNGLAPGMIADAATALLIRRGFAEAQVDAGELRLTGARRVPVALPELGLTLRAARAAVAVSRPGALTLPGGSGHILTRDGAAPAWAAVAAIAPTAAEADALSTAVASAPADAAPALAAACGGAVFARAPDGPLRRFGAPDLLKDLPT
jgi:thiamine biosynthesis lipoprotein